MNLSKRVLSGWPSIFLDAIRFLAAIIVLITHTRAVWYPEGELDALTSNLSHGAVVIFFVLSGFVIAHTTSSNNRGVNEYAIARLSRLYSVFLPAIVITLICVCLIGLINPEIYKSQLQPGLPFRYLISLVFCNEIWFFSSAPIVNGPIWSLSYEFWYYAIFGAFFYRPKGIAGIIVPLLTCLIAGPKILMLMLMLMWLVGWVVYHLPKPAIKNQLAWVIMAILLIISGYLMIFLPSWPHPVNTTHLHWADKFLSDWLVSIFVGTAFYFLPNGQKNTTASSAVIKFRKIADTTFPIYVLHFPLLLLSRSILLYAPLSKDVQFLISLGAVFLSCTVIGLFLERKRKWWTNLFKVLFLRMNFIKVAI